MKVVEVDKLSLCREKYTLNIRDYLPGAEKGINPGQNTAHSKKVKTVFWPVSNNCTEERLAKKLTLIIRTTHPGNRKHNYE